MLIDKSCRCEKIESLKFSSQAFQIFYANVQQHDVRSPAKSRDGISRG